jgi:hypothetical protein
MNSNTRFTLTVLCLLGLAFIFGALFQADYIRQQSEARLSSLTEREIKAEHADTYTLAGVSLADSIAFEQAAELAHHLDLPEEMPLDGDTVCAYVRADTIFVQHWHGYPEQAGLFRYIQGGD